VQQLFPTHLQTDEKNPLRVGVIFCGLERANLAALKYLILETNRQQTLFQYELYEVLWNDPFLRTLGARPPIDRDETRDGANEFVIRCDAELNRQISDACLKESTPEYYVVISLARFRDGYFSLRQSRISVLALGNWKREMAPPSIFEAILTLLLREGVSAVSPKLRSSVHLGTKGCLCDFTNNLAEAKYKVLGAFICAHCRAALSTDVHPSAINQITRTLARGWVGSENEPGSVANTVAKLGHSLFTTKGLRATWWEKLYDTLTTQAMTQLLALLGAILLALLLAKFGLASK
jgi:hypothetical protein